MKIFFAGTPEFAVPALREIAETFNVCAVLTAPDKPSGRSKKIAHSPVKERALSLKIPVLQPFQLDSPFLEQVRDIKPDILVVVAYGKIFKKDFLDLFPLGGLNCHPSLLPLFRGPAPIPAAILSGEKETGVTIQRLGLKMDSGEVLLQEKRPLDGSETTGSLTAEFAETGARMLVSVLGNILNSRDMQAMQQDEGKATFCRLINKEEGKIDWSMPAGRIERMIRAYTPWPHAYTSWNDKIILLLEAEIYKIEKKSETASPGEVFGIDKGHGILINTGEGVLCVKRLQVMTKKAMDYKSFLNGHPNFVGSVLV
ncbi:MAG: methionyl-tRNA formyltransferase [Spirochaetales bacterium]|nr:methionyl-tRNA formyltransferase [Spirochaetales bacterium]